MTDKKKYTEKELFKMYKDEAEKQLSKMTGLQRSMVESTIHPLFVEYGKRYLSGPVTPENENKPDFLGDIHRKAVKGELSTPDEMEGQMMDLLSGSMNNMAAVVNDDGVNVVTEPKSTTDPKQKKESMEKIKFDYKPRDIVTFLDKTIIGQPEAKKTLARAVYYHYNAIQQDLKGSPIQEYQKNNVILVGQPGSGKTTLVRKVAELLNVPFTRFDATQFSPTGIVGKDAAGIIREMVQAAKQKHQLAEYGIVFVDEFDKLVKGYGVQNQGAGADSFGKDIQATFLRILEDQEIDAMPENHPLGMLGLGGKEKIKTKYMLFIVAGAFDGLEGVVEKRIGHKTIGFKAPNKESESFERKQALLQYVTQSDLVEYGFISQLAGRLPIITALHELRPEHLYQILTRAEGNILQQYCQQIKTATDTAIQFDDAALHEFAKRAYALKTGARGLITVCENALKDLMFELPQFTGIDSLNITKDFLDRPKEMIFANFINSYIKEHDIILKFSPEAVEHLLNLSDKDPFLYLEEQLEVLPAALRLVDQKEFTITPEFLSNPKEFLQKVIEGRQQEARNT